MPIITFTEADKMSGKTLEAGVYPMEIAAISDPQASKSQKSVSYFVTFRVISGPYMNKELEIAFNTETNAASMLGTLQFVPHNWFMKLAAAIKNVPYDSLDLALDTDELKGKPFDALVTAEEFQGNAVNMIVSIFPAGTGSKGMTF